MAVKRGIKPEKRPDFLALGPAWKASAQHFAEYSQQLLSSVPESACYFPASGSLPGSSGLSKPPSGLSSNEGLLYTGSLLMPPETCFISSSESSPFFSAALAFFFSSLMGKLLSLRPIACLSRRG